jgi:hypothetical protein
MSPVHTFHSIPQRRTDMGLLKIALATALVVALAFAAFTFDAQGLIESVRADARGRTEGGKIVMRPWEGRWSNHQLREGMRVPLSGEVAWLLDVIVGHGGAESPCGWCKDKWGYIVANHFARAHCCALRPRSVGDQARVRRGDDDAADRHRHPPGPTVQHTGEPSCHTSTVS